MRRRLVVRNGDVLFVDLDFLLALYRTRVELFRMRRLAGFARKLAQVDEVDGFHVG
jgi:hypothetical protein